MQKFRKAKGHSRSADFTEPLEQRVLLASITVNSSSNLQTIESLGGNYALGQFTGFVNDAIGDYTLQNLNPKMVRVQLPVAEFEPANDDSNTNNFNWANFKDSGKVHDLFVFLQKLSGQGKIITASVFNAPDWMVTSATQSRYNQRVLRPEAYDEMIEAMAAFLKRAKDTYGVTIQTVSINESDGGYRVLLTAGQYADLVKKGGAKFASLGLSTKWVIGDSYYTKGADDFARNILNVSGVKQYAVAISYHSWWSEDLADSEWKKMSDLGKEFGLPIWANETGFWALASKQQPSILTNWDGAFRLSKIYNKVLRLSGATQLLYWQYQKDFPIMATTASGTMNLYPSYYIIKELVDNIQPGSQIVSTSTDDGTVLGLAAKDTAHNRFLVQGTNTSKTASKTVTFKGLPNQALTLTRDSASERSKVIGSYQPVNGELTFTLPAYSVSTLTGKFTGGPVSPPPPPPPPTSPPPPPPPPPASPPPPPPTTVGLPSGWASADVGDTGKAGVATYASAKGVFEMSGAGYDIGGLADSFQYVYKSLAGDGVIIARVTAIENTNISAKASVMLRNSLSSKSKEASLSLTPANGLWLQTRKTTRGNSGAVDMGNTVAAPEWLKVQRSGDMFIFFRSEDGTNWTQIAKSTIEMNDSILVGLAVTSRDLDELNTSFFDHVSVTNGAQAQAAAITGIAKQTFAAAPEPIVKSIFASEKKIDDVI